MQGWPKAYAPLLISKHSEWQHGVLDATWCVRRPLLLEDIVKGGVEWHGSSLVQKSQHQPGRYFQDLLSNLRSVSILYQV